MKNILIGLVLLTTFSSISAWSEETIALDGTDIEFQMTGKDLPIKRAFVTIRCLRSATFFERLNNGAKDYENCDDFAINGSSVSSHEIKIELQKLSATKFHLVQQVINFSKNRKGHTCMRISVELGKTQGSATNIYVNPADNYSLLSYCTVEKLPFSINTYVYENRRVNRLSNFNMKLNKPITVLLKNE